MVKNPLYKFFFTLPFFLLALAFVILLTTLLPYYQVPSPPPRDIAILAPLPTTPPPSSPEYAVYHSPDLGLELAYPANFKITETKQGITITNYIKVNFMTQRPSQIIVDNFKLTISPMSGSFDSVKTKFYLDDNSSISRGDHIFLTGWEGVEFTGEMHYLLRLGDNKWLAINHSRWYDLDTDPASRDQPGFLPNEKQAAIVDEILASIKLSTTSKP